MPPIGASWEAKRKKCQVSERDCGRVISRTVSNERQLCIAVVQVHGWSDHVGERVYPDFQPGALKPRVICNSEWESSRPAVECVPRNGNGDAGQQFVQGRTQFMGFRGIHG